MARLTSLTIGAKLALIIPLLIVGSVALFAFNLIEFREKLYESRTQDIQHAVELAKGITQSFEERSRKGDLTDTEARAGAMAEIKKLRYGGDADASHQSKARRQAPDRLQGPERCLPVPRNGRCRDVQRQRHGPLSLAETRL